MVLSFGEFQFDRDRRQLFRAGAEVHLPPRTFRLLELLLEQRPRVIPKAELIETIWPDVVVEEGNLKTTVSELREALGDPIRPSRYIRTVHRFGYGFCAEAHEEARAPAAEFQLVAQGRVQFVPDGETIIGRNPLCGVRIDSSEVSRQHARIRIDGVRVVLEDLGSKNGTWIRGERIDGPVELHHGDRIRFGTLPVLFRACRSDEPTRSANVKGTPRSRNTMR